MLFILVPIAVLFAILAVLAVFPLSRNDADRLLARAGRIGKYDDFDADTGLLVNSSLLSPWRFDYFTVTGSQAKPLPRRSISVQMGSVSNSVFDIDILPGNWYSYNGVAHPAGRQSVTGLCSVYFAANPAGAANPDGAAKPAGGPTASTAEKAVLAFDFATFPRLGAGLGLDGDFYVAEWAPNAGTGVSRKLALPAAGLVAPKGGVNPAGDQMAFIEEATSGRPVARLHLYNLMTDAAESIDLPMPAIVRQRLYTNGTDDDFRTQWQIDWKGAHEFDIRWTCMDEYSGVNGLAIWTATATPSAAAGSLSVPLVHSAEDVIFSKDGRFYARNTGTYADSVLELVRLSDRETIRIAMPNNRLGIRFDIAVSPSGRFAAIKTLSEVIIVDLADNRLRAYPNVLNRRLFGEDTLSVGGFSTDDRLIVSSRRDPQADPVFHSVDPVKEFA